MPKIMDSSQKFSDFSNPTLYLHVFHSHFRWEAVQLPLAKLSEEVRPQWWVGAAPQHAPEEPLQAPTGHLSLCTLTVAKTGALHASWWLLILLFMGRFPKVISFLPFSQIRPLTKCTCPFFLRVQVILLRYSDDSNYSLLPDLTMTPSEQWIKFHRKTLKATLSPKSIKSDWMIAGKKLHGKEIIETRASRFASSDLKSPMQ